MKGLFTKDLLILRNQWKTLAMILFIGIVIAVTNSPGAILVYLPIISGMLVLGTLSYDEMDNSHGYLFTLPASRRTYVKEKYLFSLAVVILAMAISIIACIIIMMLSAEPPVIYWDEVLVNTGVSFIFVMLLLAVEIPLRLKFGIEKSRIALYVMFGVLAIGAVLISRHFPEDGLSDIGELFISKGFAIISTAPIISLILLYLSSVLSTKILSEKEF